MLKKNKTNLNTRSQQIFNNFQKSYFSAVSVKLRLKTVVQLAEMWWGKTLDKIDFYSIV